MSRKEWAAFIGLSLIWGSSFLFIKIAIQEVGPITLAGTRVVIGALALVLTLIARRVVVKLNRQQWVVLMVIGTLNTALPFALISWAEIRLDSSIAAILNGTVPLFTAILAYFWLREERLSRQKILGLFIGFAGVVIVITRNGLAEVRFDLVSQLAMLLAALCYAFSSVYIRKNTVGIPLIVQAAGSLIFASLLLWIGALLFEQPIVVPANPQIWIALLWLGLAGSYLAYLLYYYLLSSAGPTKSVMVTYIMPLVGVALGILVLGETINLQIMLGTLFVVSSVIIVNR